MRPFAGYELAWRVGAAERLEELDDLHVLTAELRRTVG